VPDDDLKEMIEEHDHDGDKALNFNEFVRMMLAKWWPVIAAAVVYD